MTARSVPATRATFRLAIALAVALAIVLAPVVSVALAGPALAAEPTATPPAGGDPRSSGEGPGFVGEPGLAFGVVLAIAVVSVIATLAYVKATERRR